MNHGSLHSELRLIADMVPTGATLLDIGCEYGTLLRHVQDTKQVDGRGIEIDQEKVSVCVANGLSVIQGDADRDLQHYPDQAFDVAVLSIALQMMHRPKDVLEQMLRIANKAIVAIPNFGHWKNRCYLGLRGRMPVTSALSYEWYETPNIHFCTLRDFNDLASAVGAEIIRSYALNESGAVMRGSGLLTNLLAVKGVYELKRRSA